MLRPSTRKSYDPVFLLLLGAVFLALGSSFAVRVLIANYNAPAQSSP